MKKIDFFQDKEKEFIAFVSPMIDPYIFKEDEFIYKEEEEIELIYFLSRGVAGFVLPDHENMIYATLENGDKFGHLDLFEGLQAKDLTQTGLKRQYSVMTLSDHC